MPPRAAKSKKTKNGRSKPEPKKPSGRASSMELAAARTRLREALDVGIAELNAGLGVEGSPDALMAEICAEVGIKRP